MRAPTQSPRLMRCDDPIVDFDSEGIGRKQSPNPTALQAEIDGIREAIRLNWLEMGRLKLSQIDRWAIRANSARLGHILAALLTLSARRANSIGSLETESAFSQNAELLEPASHDAELLLFAPPERPHPVEANSPPGNAAERQARDPNA